PSGRLSSPPKIYFKYEIGWKTGRYFDDKRYWDFSDQGRFWIFHAVRARVGQMESIVGERQSALRRTPGGRSSSGPGIGCIGRSRWIDPGHTGLTDPAGSDTTHFHHGGGSVCSTRRGCLFIDGKGHPLRGSFHRTFVDGPRKNFTRLFFEQ